MPERNISVFKTAQLDVVSDLTLLPRVLEWFTQFQADTEVPRSIWLQANIALTEGFTNAVRHAHNGLSSSTPIVLKAELSEGFFHFEIWDQGGPYDFDQAIVQIQNIISAPDFDPLVHEQHWGSVIFLNLIRQHHWHIDYSRQGASQNRLRATLRLPAGLPSEFL